MTAKKTTGFVLSLTIVWMVMSAGTPALADTDIFYGQNSLNPLIDGDKIMLAMPGGARVKMGKSQATYVVTDHLQSTRVAIRRDNTVSGQIDYTPFGERVGETSEDKTNLTRSYTGQVLEGETATYDFNARRYDPSVGRFGSVDAIRQSISPYSYTENDPVNHVDPTGLGTTHFWLHSVEGVPAGFVSYEEKMIDMIKTRFENLPTSEQLTVVESELFTRTPPAHPILESVNDKVGHLTVSLPQKNFAIEFLDQVLLNESQLTTDTDRLFDLQPTTGITRQFARYISADLKVKSPRIAGELKSILIENSGFAFGSSGHESGIRDSLLDHFSAIVQEEFPQIESVMASKYQIDVIRDQDPNFLNIRASRYDLWYRRKLEYKVSIQDYYSNNLPPYLFTQKPSPKMGVEAVISDGVRYTQPNFIEEFIEKNNFVSPLFEIRNFQ